MGRKEDILEIVRQIAAPLAAQEGLELIDVEIGGGGGRQALRLFIDKAGGVSLDDCSSVSRAVSAALDVEDQDVIRRLAGDGDPRAARVEDQ